MANQNVRGRFVWHELETPERESAHEFYSAVLGWRTEPFEQDPSYAMFSAPSGPLGGAVALRDDGARWLPYVETDDIDATLAEAARLGASVLEDVTAIPNGSKYAILRDPQGACFAVYQSGAPDEEAAAAGKSRAAEVGEFNWHELATEDFGAAFDFYSRLFGWETVSEYDMGPRGVYLIFGREGQSLGGIFNKGDAGLPGGAYWLGYVRVPDVNEASTLVKARGGTVVAGPMEVPGGDWIAQCIDPQGALFALQTSAEDMRSLQGSGADESSSTDSSSSGSSSSSAAAAGDADSDEVAAPKASKKRASKKRAKKKESSKKLSSKKTATKKAGQKKAAKKKVAKKKVAKKKANNKKKAAKKKAVTKKAAAKRPVASKAGSKKAASKKVAKKTGTKKKGTKKKATKKKAANKKASKKKAGKKTKTKTKAKRTTKKARPNRAQAKNKKARAKKARAKKAPTTKTRRR